MIGVELHAVKDIGAAHFAVAGADKRKRSDGRQGMTHHERAIGTPHPKLLLTSREHELFPRRCAWRVAETGAVARLAHPPLAGRPINGPTVGRS